MTAAGLEGKPLRKLLRRFENSERRNLHLLLAIKRSFHSSLGLEEGFRAFREQVAQPDADHLQRLPIASLARAAAASPHYFEIAPAGVPFTIEPPRVIGAGNQQTLSGHSRTLYLTRLDEVSIRGRSGVVVAADRVLVDCENDESSWFDDQLDVDPAVFARTGHEVSACMPDGGGATVVDEAFWLCGAHTIAFGHWLLEYLPKYAAARLSGRLPAGLPILIDAGMPLAHRRSLEILYAGAAPIIELPPFALAKIKRLWLVPSLAYAPLQPLVNERSRAEHICAPPSRIAAIARELGERAGHAAGPFEGPDRVFMARRPERHRAMVNSAAIEAAAAAAGFSIVYPEDLDFVDQLRLVRSARFIVGPEGSAMSLVMFARAGTRQCLLSHPFVIGMPASTGFHEALGIDTTIMTGPIVREHDSYPHMADYVIDADAFAGFLARWPSEDIR